MAEGLKKLDIDTLNKKDLKALISMRCIHHGDILAKCLCADVLHSEGIFDIETNNLTADFGITLCASIFMHGKLYSVVIDKEGFEKADDRKVIEEIARWFRYVRYLIVHNAEFDINFLRSKFIEYDIEIPKHLSYVDTCEILRNKLRLSGNSLHTATKFLDTKTKKYFIEGKIWKELTSWKEKNIAEILVHNQADVLSLKEVWQRLKRLKYTVHYF